MDSSHFLSHRVQSMSESATLEMTRKSRELKEKGIDVITLSIGEPDFDTPEAVKRAAMQAIQQNDTHYPPVPGTMPLRKAIAKKLWRDNQLQYDATQIIVSNGAKQSINNVFMSILNEGDEVIIPAPYWVSYPEMVKMAGGTPVYIQTTVKEDFKISPQQLLDAITQHTKAFIFSSPCNPSGSVYSKDELKALADVFEKHPHVLIISDEIYELIRFDGEHQSIAQFESIKENVVVVNGMSKGFAMTGWRVGYVAAPKAIADACNTIQGQYTSGSCTISQAAALEAINTIPEKSAEMSEMVLQFKKRRDLLFKLLSEIEGVIPNLPLGAFYLFPDISHYFGKSDGEKTIQNSNDLCMYLLDKAHVALVSGDAFGCDSCIRFSYATTEPLLTEAVKRIQTALQLLK